ncbi:MAG: phosphate ABC transporter permease subunit PstC [Planctomycetaceae bacterium]|nr:phosphate ABC transporter permease subunit PstC [Planctomycetaceae bacterium]
MFPSKSDFLLRLTTCLLSWVSALILVLIVWFLFVESELVWREVGVLRFLTDDRWSPSGDFSSAQFGLFPMIVASLLLAVGSILLAAPIGVGAALFAAYYAPRGVRQIFPRIVELLGGIPSVVYGLWGLVVLVPLISAYHPPGTSLLAGIVVVAIMILPTVALLTLSTFQQLPTSLIHSAAALGIAPTGIVRSVILPASRSGIMTAVLLAVTRAVGETMAVLMVCGNVIQAPSSPFSPVRTLTANIALEMAYAMQSHRSALFATGLALMLVVTLLVLIAEQQRGKAGHV